MAAPLVPRQTPAPAPGDSSTEEQLLKLVSSPFQSSVSPDSFSCLPLILTTAVPIQCLLVFVRRLAWLLSLACRPFLLHTTTPYPCLRTEDQTCRREACPAAYWQGSSVMDTSRSNSKRTISHREDWVGCCGLSAIHEDAEEHFSDTRDHWALRDDPGQCWRPKQGDIYWSGCLLDHDTALRIRQWVVGSSRVCVGVRCCCWILLVAQLQENS